MSRNDIPSNSGSNAVNEEVSSEEIPSNAGGNAANDEESSKDNSSNAGSNAKTPYRKDITLNTVVSICAYSLNYSTHAQC